METQQTHKPHRVPKKGEKFDKKKIQEKKKAGKEGQTAQKNPKAFTFRSSRASARGFRRTGDIKEKRLHLPKVVKDEQAPPPIIVAVVGPPKSGKTTLIKSLIKHYIKINISECQGPITIVIAKNKRLTLFECPNEINAMIDIAKVADLVLLTVDASYGFEMETFEFLNILQIHGFPRVMGVLTHLDGIKKKSHLLDVKRQLKHRFWKEIYDGAKLFYISGATNGRYWGRDILNLARFISVTKFRPLVWRGTHPSILVDRFEETTSPQKISTDPTCHRNITLFGYLKGTNLKQNMKIHIPGSGDYFVKNMSSLDDPCPPPSKVKTGRKNLNTKEKVIYGPMSNLGNLFFDKDAIYISVKKSNDNKDNKDDEDDEDDDDEDMESEIDEEERASGQVLMKKLKKINTTSTINSKLEDSTIQLFKSGISFKNTDTQSDEEMEDNEENEEDNEIEDEEDIDNEEEEDNNEELNDDEDEDEDEQENEQNNDDRTRRRAPKTHDENENEEDEKEEVVFDDSDDEAESSNRWRSNIDQQVLLAKKDQLPILMNLIYGSQSSVSIEDEDEDEDEEQDQNNKNNSNIKDAEEPFFSVKDKTKEEQQDILDTAKFSIPIDSLPDWEDTEFGSVILHKFVKFGEDQNTNISAVSKKEEVAFGDFEDLEKGIVHKAAPTDEKTEIINNAIRLAEKQMLKESFDSKYDHAEDGGDIEEEKEKQDYMDLLQAKVDKQTEINNAAFAADDPAARVQYEGYRVGAYLRLELENIPCEMVKHFNPANPLLVGGLQPQEESLGFIQVRIKKHRWHKKILKSNDPLIFSIGWRRFQSLPIYSIEDRNGRNRMLKYTPLHMHCMATFYGPLTPPNTGIVAFKTLSNSLPSFRVSATGVVLELNQSFNVMKKLKITGTPIKTFKNTAYIEGMFSSELEVAKFEGASIRTVSGVRGHIKKALKNSNGAFRATFEDKILKSDIVFLRTWYPVKPTKFYNPVASLLIGDGNQWVGMRTSNILRQETGISPVSKSDSNYKPVERMERKFLPLVIPLQLQKSLPFSMQPKYIKAQKKEHKSVKKALIVEPHEKKAMETLQKLKVIRDYTLEKSKEARNKKLEAVLKKQAEWEETLTERRKVKRKAVLREESIRNKRKSTGDNEDANPIKRKKQAKSYKK